MNLLRGKLMLQQKDENAVEVNQRTIHDASMFNLQPEKDGHISVTIKHFR